MPFVYILYIYRIDKHPKFSYTVKKTNTIYGDGLNDTPKYCVFSLNTYIIGAGISSLIVCVGMAESMDGKRIAGAVLSCGLQVLFVEGNGTYEQ